MNPQLPARQKACTHTKTLQEGRGEGTWRDNRSIKEVAQRKEGAQRKEVAQRKRDSAWMKEIVLRRSRAVLRCGGHQKDWVVVVGAS